ncbi:MAG: cold shock domain-containing protein, partial [Rhodoglobus sp.]|nr:cold shock domain-containing protein [Rhodoglobus sp.]
MPKQRLNGLLVTWNDDRGFGFVRPSNGSPDAFVHIRDFGTIVGRPQVGDPISYRQEPGRDGRPAAVDVRGPARLAAEPTRSPLGSALFGFSVVIGFVAAYALANALAP